MSYEKTKVYTKMKKQKLDYKILLKYIIYIVTWEFPAVVI
jgi:hypothetical protein